MNVVGPRPRHDIQRPARKPAHLHTHVAGLRAEFLHRVRERKVEILIQDKEGKKRLRAYTPDAEDANGSSSSG